MALVSTALYRPAGVPFAAAVAKTKNYTTKLCTCRCTPVTAAGLRTNPSRARKLGAPSKRLNARHSQDSPVHDLRVPSHWFLPSNAVQESNWLRAALHKWLDDEYMPEPANVEISDLAARSYYESLIEKQADLGDILLKMASDLETLSFQESFHGAFSSANAAAGLIARRIESCLEK